MNVLQIRRRCRGALGLLASVLVGAVLTLTVGAAPAAAHDVLTGTVPASGATVARTPSAVVLTFDQPAVAMGTQVLVTGPSGQVQSGTPRLVDTTVTQDVRPGAPAGAYTVAWRVTSADGHPVSGTFTFTSSAPGSGTATPVPATPTPDAPTRIASDVPWGGWIALGVVVLLVLAGAAVVLRRASGGGEDPDRS